MQVDKTTLKDLSIINADEDQALLHHLNHCITVNGRDQLFYSLQQPLRSAAAIRDVQDVLKYILKHKAKWPMGITNGTIMVIERFYNSGIATPPADASPMSTRMYQLSNNADYSLVKYSMQHFFDFFKGMLWFADNFDDETTPSLLREYIREIRLYVDRPVIQNLKSQKKPADLNNSQLLRLAYFSLHQHKRPIHRLLEIFAQFDAWYGMAEAIEKYRYVFPNITENAEPYFHAQGLFHPLVKNYVSYDIELNQHKNFLFLTGANMAGKSTFIKAVGIATYLAHVGMAVPASSLRINFFEGMLSNINVSDNVIKGESYFYNEVRRIKATVETIRDGRHWLVLIDELFKGTNVQDAMKCSSAVINGLLKIRNSLFIVSTHLYEIGEALKAHDNIAFYYFETEADNDELKFSYRLKPGISNDRLGYLILKREGVVKMLDEL